VFGSAVLKLTAFCNLDCTYCYMFSLADRTFERVPREMPVATALQFLDRLAEYLPLGSHFGLVLHGGEPTLWPVAHFKVLLERVEQMREQGIDLDVVMQTNGLRIPHDLPPLLSQHGVQLGVSLDGPQPRNDTFRVLHSGAGSYDRVMKSLELLHRQGHGGLVSGFLSVANPDIPPEEFLTWVDGLPVRRLDVLWPIEYHYGEPPWMGGSVEQYMASPRYGTWFADLFDLWFARDDPDLYIRVFFDALSIMGGGTRHSDSLVNDHVDILVVNTDGGIELPDYFRAARDGGSRTPYDVRTPLSVVEQDSTFSQLARLGELLPDDCQGCPHRRVCGGGFLPGRLGGPEQRLDRRSVLCFDHYALFSRMARVAGIPAPLL
jgi:uncharacterized protein